MSEITPHKILNRIKNNTYDNESILEEVREYCEKTEVVDVELVETLLSLNISAVTKFLTNYVLKNKRTKELTCVFVKYAKYGIVRNKLKELLTEEEKAQADKVCMFLYFDYDCDILNALKVYNDETINNECFLKYLEKPKNTDLVSFEGLIIDDEIKYKVMYEITFNLLRLNKNVKVTDYIRKNIKDVMNELIENTLDKECEKKYYTDAFLSTPKRVLTDIFENISHCIDSNYNDIILKMHQSTSIFALPLSDIAHYIGIDKFIEIIDINNNVESNLMIFKRVKGVDISSLLYLYKTNENYFCANMFSYCTDVGDEIEKVKWILFKMLNENKYAQVSNILNNIVTSHFYNLTNNCINNISKETSSNILKTFMNEEFLTLYIQKFVACSSGEKEEGLKILLTEYENKAFLTQAAGFYLEQIKTLTMNSSKLLRNYLFNYFQLERMHMDCIFENIIAQNNVKAYYNLLNCLYERNDRTLVEYANDALFDSRITEILCKERLEIIVRMYNGVTDKILKEKVFEEISMHIHAHKAKSIKFLEVSFVPTAEYVEFIKDKLSNITNENMIVYLNVVNYIVKESNYDILTNTDQILFSCTKYRKICLEILNKIIDHENSDAYTIFEIVTRFVAVDYRKHNKIIKEILEKAEKKGIKVKENKKIKNRVMKYKHSTKQNEEGKRRINKENVEIRRKR